MPNCGLEISQKSLSLEGSFLTADEANAAARFMVENMLRENQGAKKIDHDKLDGTIAIQVKADDQKWQVEVRFDPGTSAS